MISSLNSTTQTLGSLNFKEGMNQLHRHRFACSNTCFLSRFSIQTYLLLYFPHEYIRRPNSKVEVSSTLALMFPSETILKSHPKLKLTLQFLWAGLRLSVDNKPFYYEIGLTNTCRYGLASAFKFVMF